jgi:hypothetical protein
MVFSTSSNTGGAKIRVCRYRYFQSHTLVIFNTQKQLMRGRPFSKYARKWREGLTQMRTLAYGGSTDNVRTHRIPGGGTSTTICLVSNEPQFSFSCQTAGRSRTVGKVSQLGSESDTVWRVCPTSLVWPHCRLLLTHR